MRELECDKNNSHIFIIYFIHNVLTNFDVDEIAINSNKQTDMTYSIKQTAKGYLIFVKENQTKHKYFLRDDMHTKERYIEFILKYNDFKLGMPFGDSIYPIYVDYKVYDNRMNDINDPFSLAVEHYKRTVVFMYYRSFITEESPTKVIKQYANEFKSNLKLMGLDKLYKYVKTQA